MPKSSAIAAETEEVDEVPTRAAAWSPSGEKVAFLAEDTTEVHHLRTIDETLPMEPTTNNEKTPGIRGAAG